MSDHDDLEAFGLAGAERVDALVDAPCEADIIKGRDEDSVSMFLERRRALNERIYKELLDVICKI